MKKMFIASMMLLLPMLSLWSMEDGLLGKIKKSDSGEIKEFPGESNQSEFSKKPKIEPNEEVSECHWDLLPNEMKEYVLLFVMDFKKIQEITRFDKVGNLPAFIKQYTYLRGINKHMRGTLPEAWLKRAISSKKLFLTAAKSGDVKLLNLMYDSGFDRFLHAKLKDDKTCLRLLANEGFDTKSRQNCEELLMSAIGYGQIPFCRELLKKGFFPL